MKTDSEKITFKTSIKQACINLLLERIHNVSQAMAQAQESANNQEKSSVGDKHETSRAISQAEHNMNAAQLSQAKKDLGFLETINVQQISNTVAKGSVFKLTEHLFFVAVGLGTINVNGTLVMVISHLSPLFLSLKMKKAGDRILFQNKHEHIKDIY